MFLAFSTLGLVMTVSTVEMISLFIALEISSYSLFIVLPLRTAGVKTHLEASMKYLFFSVVCSALSFYGLSYLYGVSGTTFLTRMAPAYQGHDLSPLAIMALMMTLAAILFKLSVFPFHFWAPDITEGASNVTAAYINTLPKLAGGAILIRIVQLVSPQSPQIVAMLAVLAVASMTYGNLLALIQKDLKRLIAYSGIAHAGYLLLGVIALDVDGYTTALFYLVGYLVMNLAIFTVITILSEKGHNLPVRSLGGLAHRSHLLAFTLGAAAFSLAGIPPLVGFAGKLFVFSAALRTGHGVVVVLAAANAAISIFYYLNLARLAYTQAGTEEIRMRTTPVRIILCGILVVLLFALGLLPGGFLELFRSVLS